MRDPKRIQGSSRRREDPLPDVDLHAKEGKNRFHGERERERERRSLSNLPAKALDALPSRGREKMRIQRARNSHPTRTMKSNARVSIELRNIQSKHMRSFLSNIYFASSRRRSARISSFLFRGPKRPSSPFCARKSPVLGKEEMSIAARTVVLLARRENESYENQIEITYSF